MLFYLFYVIGFALLSLTLLVTWRMLFLSHKSMLQKSQRTSQSKPLKFNKKPNIKYWEKSILQGIKHEPIATTL